MCVGTFTSNKIIFLLQLPRVITEATYAHMHQQYETLKQK